MAVPLIGEILDDGVTLAVFPDGGNAAEAAYAAATLQTLTPLFSKADVPGALVTGLSWATCVQLSRTFGDYWRPQPRLVAWLQDQVIARTSRQPMVYEPPAAMTPYWWQREGADLIAATGRALITDEPGVGKTATAILGIVEWSLRRGVDVGPVVVVCPASVIDSWVREWRMWAPHVRVVAWRGANRKKLSGTADVYVTSYDTARLDAPEVSLVAALLNLEPGALIVDECFPAGTPVTTPTGSVAIEDLRPGDEVIGVDHRTGEPVVTVVKGTQSRVTQEPLTAVNGVELTPNHPVWTTEGYVRADAVPRDTEVCRVTLINSGDDDLHAELRMVRADVHSRAQEQQAPEILQPGVLGEVADVAAGVRRVVADTCEACSQLGEPSSLAREPGGESGVGGTPARPGQPLPGSGHQGEVTRDAEGAGLPDAHGRERPVDGAADPAGGTAGLAYGGRGADGPEVSVAARLQDRRGLHGAHGRSGVGRTGAQQPDSQGARREEGRAADLAWLDGSAVLEQGRAGGPRSGGAADRVVYNIETGTGNYVAGGLLVHNCHFIKNGQARRTKAVLRIASAVQKRGGAVVGLSGTPITRDTGDIHPMLKALDEPAWPSKERMIGRYCMTVQGDYDEKILGLEPMRAEEFHLCLLGQHRRIAKADVLPDLPDKVYSIRTVELPAKWRKVYDDFEASMFAEMPDGTELSVFDEMSAYTHRSALSSAPGTVEVTFGPDEDKDTGLPKRHVSIKLNEYDPSKPDGGSWKVSALLEILDERGGPKACKPTIAFAPSRQLVEIAGKAAAKEGYRVGYVVGGQSAKVRTADVDAFQSGELDLICVTTQAGGVGLTLTAADAIVVLQRPWALDESIQLEDRAHRIGAEHESLQIIDIVAKDTIDGRRRESLPEKARHLAEFVQDDRVVDHLLGGKNVAEHNTTPRELISA
jgi:hypothetical protein